jgi:hypothetical protein
MAGINIAVFESAPSGFKTVPVRDDGFAPDLRVGEFAIIDMSNREPEVGALVQVKGANPEAHILLCAAL